MLDWHILECFNLKSTTNNNKKIIKVQISSKKIFLINEIFLILGNVITLMNKLIAKILEIISSEDYANIKISAF